VENAISRSNKDERFAGKVPTIQETVVMLAKLGGFLYRYGKRMRGNPHEHRAGRTSSRIAKKFTGKELFAGAITEESHQ